MQEGTEHKITHLFCDVGGVLLSNGWDRYARARAAEKFGLEAVEFEEKHKLFFDAYEVGKISLDDYLKYVVFFNERSFTPAEFADFIFAQTTSDEQMIGLIKFLKQANNLKLGTVNNEGKELNEFRIRHFGLTTIFDFFISSGHTHLRKPDVDIWKLALNVAQVKPENALYIDDRELLVEVASGLGLHGIVHRNYEQTVAEFKSYGLVVPE